jgi:S1-C subfamily serine protease
MPTLKSYFAPRAVAAVAVLVAIALPAFARQGGSWTGSGSSTGTGGSGQSKGSDAQPQKMRIQIDADKAIMIDELMMLVADTSGKLRVQFIAPAERRPAAAAKMDIAPGDELAMAGGKKVESLKQLRELYETAKPGEEIKMGLRRGERSYLISFTKMDPKDLPKKMVIRRGDGNPNEAVLPALGVMAMFENGKLVVMETFPNASEDIAKGDVVVSLNGKKAADAKELNAIYDATEMGAELKLELTRDGKTISVAAKREPPPGAVIKE